MAAFASVVRSGTEVEIKKGSATVAVIEFKGASAPRFTPASVAKLVAAHGGNRCLIQHNYIRSGTTNHSYPYTLAEYTMQGGKAVKTYYGAKTPV